MLNTRQAAGFAAAVHAAYPGKMLAYNLSPSFNWDAAGAPPRRAAPPPPPDLQAPTRHARPPAAFLPQRAPPLTAVLCLGCPPGAAGMSDTEIEAFTNELGKRGFVWQFITLAGFHSNGLVTHNFAKAFAERGMGARGMPQMPDLPPAPPFRATAGCSAHSPRLRAAPRTLQERAERCGGRSSSRAKRGQSRRRRRHVSPQARTTR